MRMTRARWAVGIVLVLLLVLGTLAGIQEMNRAPKMCVTTPC